jgi:hypothetical protein
LIHLLLAEENDWVPAAVFGGALFVAGLWMIYMHKKAWSIQRDDQNLDEHDRQHFANRFQRRMQTSAGISFVGVLIAVGDQPVIWQLGPMGSSLYWVFVMLVACWIGLLALGDMTSTKSYTAVTRAKLENERRELEQELAKLKEQSRP